MEDDSQHFRQRQSAGPSRSGRQLSSSTDLAAHSRDEPVGQYGSYSSIPSSLDGALDMRTSRQYGQVRHDELAWHDMGWSEAVATSAPEMAARGNLFRSDAEAGESVQAWSASDPQDIVSQLDWSFLSVSILGDKCGDQQAVQVELQANGSLAPYSHSRMSAKMTVDGSHRQRPTHIPIKHSTPQRSRLLRISHRLPHILYPRNHHRR